MISFDITLNSRLKTSFQSARVMSRTASVAMRALIRQAAFIRKVAKSSIRKPKGTKTQSDPGNPPYSHTGLLRQHIYFDADRVAGAVLVGPAKLNNVRQFQAPPPQVLEEGGVIKGQFVRSSSPSARRYETRIAPRPYMRPAFEKSQKRLKDFWQQARMS